MGQAVMKPEVMKKRKSFLQEVAAPRIADVVRDPKFVDRLLRVAMVAHVEQPILFECTPESVVKSLMQAGRVGLEIGGTMKHASLIPRRNKDGEYEAHFEPEYRGLQHLAMRTGRYHAIKAEVVYEADEFYWEEGSDPKLVHKPAMDAEDRGEMTHAYAIAWPKDSPVPVWRVLPKKEIERIRSHSQAFKKSSGPWITDPSTMWKKSAIKQLCDKDLEKTEELAEAIAIDDAIQSGDDKLLAALEARYGDEQKALESRLPERESRTEQVGEALAARRGAEGDEPEPEKDPDGPSRVEQLQGLMEKCAKLDLLTLEESEAFELAIHDEDADAIRDGIVELSQRYLDAVQSD